MSKKERLEKIRRFVADFEIGTQEEIVEHLRKSGMTATQATVSRDIKELGIVKTPLKDNSYIYELPKNKVAGLKLVEKNVLSSERLDNMLNLKLVPGSTAFVKNQIVEAFSDTIFSIVSDDDTILIIVRDKDKAPEVLETIKNW
ncbi:arginine repressor [Streptococcus acidominimus]|uniref:Arginine repressor n=1 Tax=Streptococcus acidominimus TaxID=1326 RepID=A0A1Q8EC54_STRAI|nr:arginine repressor [Streptococcus acidominimus]MBF0846682.1 arginine repressor [Streptococcus danieliae]MBF0819573.1 arginine repressor [Streptococcus acidominimus]MBF0837987.1 arginine repressor [Streptococcus acidominimus]OLF49368.1 arginine repressor [Streptococcus acidominimus]TFU29711.1 arginine repressor [Streptococcus acidominimus]